MTNEKEWNDEGAGTVVAYFADGEDAHRAIIELLDSGFTTSDIGAAFHSGGGQAGESVANAAVNDVEIRSMVSPGTAGSGSGISGAASDTSAVTPAGLATGAGTVTTGASRPGPIPGSEIPNGLPTNIPSTLPSSANAGAAVAETPGTAYPATGGFHETRQIKDASWWDRLKKLFGGESVEERARREAVSDTSSMNFGTGEGHLGVDAEYEYAYSGSAFQNAFSGMGVPAARAQYLSGQIGLGGAIVTVAAGSLAAEAENVLERNRGQIRYEAGVIARQQDEPAHVQIFGRVQQVYPRYVGPGSASVGSVEPEASRRKAS